jgi:hypothetical protein
MTSATTSNPKILIGASIPRSGHHFLADMMTGYFGPDLFYCEYYTLPSCCKSVPCTRRGRHRYIYQKSHDRDFKLPGDIADALYLIQYRHPVPEALSDRELELQDRLGRPNLSYRRTHAGYVSWLTGKALYYRKFHNKWIARKMPNAIYLDYPDLSANPKELMAEIVRRAGGIADVARISDVVDKVRAPRTAEDGSVQAFKPRVISDSPYFDAGLLGAFEAWVLERCPAFNFSRELTGSYEESEMYALILLKDSNEPLPKGETKRLKVAAKLAPDHPEIHRRLAMKAIREGHVANGIARLETLLGQHPFFGAGYSLLFAACADSGTPIPESVLNGNALVACSDNAELSMQLGAAFAEKGLWVNAIAAYALANTLDPTSEEASERLAAAVAGAKR